MVKRSLRLLHISDLHLGKESASGWRFRRVLGKAWADNLKALAADAPAIDLVCFTGDIVQSGQPAQFNDATLFVQELMAALNLPISRFFCVPGNHDVDRHIEQPAWKELRDASFDTHPQAFARWIAGGLPPRGCDASWPDAVMQRQQAYRDWLRAMGLLALLPSASLHPRLGWRVALDLGLEAPLHMVGLDSAWLAGDDHDAAKLRLTDEQLGRLLTSQGQPLPGWTIALLHHPPGELADGRDALRLLGEYSVNLLLHGHLHDAELARWATPAGNALHIAAAGCLYEHDRFPNSFQVLDLLLPAPQPHQTQPIMPQRLWSRAWSARSGFWHNDNSLYPNSVDGRLALVAPAPAATPFTPGSFVGRDAELAALCQALLPAVGQAARPTLLCCAVEGMAGVGKTRLAEQFISQHWLPALGLPAGSDPAEHLQRLVLDPQAPEPPTAESLGRQLADRLRCTGPAEGLWPRLVAALQTGPLGQPWLLLIENVDSPAQAAAVGGLVNRLPGCPLLVTARYQKLAGPGQGWARVPVPPLPAEQSRALLRAEVEPDGHPLTDAEADALAIQLGHLPLALHIAASHLSMGSTPAGFIAELQREGLALAPAHPADPRLSADRARAILQSSFSLSWRHWCDGPGQQPAWQQALVALAHGPASATGPALSAAITALVPDQHQAFASAAARFSLLQYSPLSQQCQLHPLMAEFLRQQLAEPDAHAVLARLTDWFMPRLPETGDETQGANWGEVSAEADALVHWLALLPAEAGAKAERAGKDFASMAGPFNAWKALCERLLPCFDAEPQTQSNLWWNLSLLARRSGDPDRALQAAEAKASLDQASGEERGWALARGAAADVLQDRGDLDEALRIRREEELPVYEKLGDQHSRAVTMGQIADVLQARGDLDAALRIRREEQLPVYDKLGDQRSRAVTMGKIADVLQDRGDLDEALRIRREEELPVYDKLGDQRERAVTMGKIADVLQARGDLDEALRIWREELLPVFDKLGEQRSRAVTMGKIADVLQARGDLDEVLRIRREEQLPVYDKLGDQRSLLVARAKLALLLLAQGGAGQRAEASQLLQLAFEAARRMGLPEAAQVAGIYQRHFGQGLPLGL